MSLPEYVVSLLSVPTQPRFDSLTRVYLAPQASGQQNMTISFLWKTAGPVSSVGPPRLFPAAPNPNLPAAVYPRQAVSIVATHSFADAPALDVLLVPGGMGNRYLNDTADTAMEDFVAARYPSLQYLLSVCTGAATLAKSGVLRGRKATTNKAAWTWATSFGDGIQWMPTARWTEDGNVWTSSGVSAGIDMTYEFVKVLLGREVAASTINGMEYTPHVDKAWDPYSIVFKVRDAFASANSLCSTVLFRQFFLPTSSFFLLFPFHGSHQSMSKREGGYTATILLTLTPCQVAGADTSRPLGDCVGPVGFPFACTGRGSRAA